MAVLCLRILQTALLYGEVKLNMRTRLALGKSFPQR
jgi:hypothetical protein